MFNGKERSFLLNQGIYLVTSGRRKQKRRDRLDPFLYLRTIPTAYSIYLPSIPSLPTAPSLHVCSTRVRRTIIPPARQPDSALHRSTITSLWFYNGSCVRGGSRVPSARTIVERNTGNRVSRAKFPPSLHPHDSLATPVQIRFIAATAPWKASRPFAPGFAAADFASCVHLFHARWNIGTREGKESLPPFLPVRKTRKA